MEQATTIQSHTLSMGYRLRGEFEISRPVSLGVASVVYLAYVDGRPCRVEEYFPARMASRRGDADVVVATAADRERFDAGLAAFLAAARILARLDHPNFVGVLAFVNANGTGYVVTEPPAGETLADRLGQRGTLGDDELKGVLNPVIDGLEAAHLAGLLHRQISPEAVVLRPDGTPVLKDFGIGAKVVGGARQVFDPRTPTRANISPGYAALEQYTGSGREGPWTDIYALGAVAYRCVVGEVPPDAPARAARTGMVPTAKASSGHGPRTLSAIDAALSIPIASRPQSLPAWQAMLFAHAEETPLARRAGRTSARGFGRATVGSGPRPGSRAAVATSAQGGEGTARRAARWAAPAAVAVGVIALMTWVDAGVLRDGKADVAAAVRAYVPVGEREFADRLRSGAAGPPMVRIEPGRLRMGCWRRDCPEPSPAREVVFERPIALAKFEITHADYAPFARDTGRPVASTSHEPVVNVSWHDAVGYARWLGAQTGRRYRLPSEAEWEYAARAGGADDETMAAGTTGRPGIGAAAAGTGLANAWGVHDMDGNVSEWVQDCGEGIRWTPPADGSAMGEAGCPRRVRRGSSWIRPPPNAGAGSRATDADAFRAMDTGFRVARDED